QAEDGIRDFHVTGVQTCALPIWPTACSFICTTRLPEPVVRRLVQMKLHAVGLLAAAGAWPRELSGGMARRVALARALALDPPLIDRKSVVQAPSVDAGGLHTRSQ